MDQAASVVSTNTNLSDEPGLIQKDSEEFVKAVMSSQTNVECVSHSPPTPTKAGKRLRRDSQCSPTRPINEPNVMTAIDLLNRNLTECFGLLTSRLDNMEKNFEQKIMQKLSSTLDKRLGKMKETVDKDIAMVKRDIADVNSSCLNAIKVLKKSYAEAAISEVGASDNCRSNNIVIRNMRESREEQASEVGVKHRVEKLVRDGLKLRDVVVVEASRKKGFGDKPGVIVATIETREQKSKLMKAKRSLRQSRDYSSVYIDNDLNRSELDTQSSLRTLLKEMGRDRDYVVQGSRLVRRTGQRTDSDSRATSNGNDRRRQGGVDRSARADHSPRRQRSDDRDRYDGFGNHQSRERYSRRR